MGTVYLGRMLGGGTEQTVAMKVLHPHLAHDPEMVAMFLDEARVATRLRHPNLVGVLDMDMIAEELVIVMDYVEGATLGAMQSALRQQGRKLPVGVALRILCDALAGLHCVHELLDESGAPLGLVHRDVSPHNLLVGSDGVTRVTDFGIALAAGRLASTRPDGTVKGKLQYLSPEQVGRKQLDRRVDVFAAGIVLWECLTGERLFEAPTEAETVTRVLRDPISPPSMVRPEIPIEIDEVCLRALERDPARRFKTADEFGDALGRAGESIADGSAVGALVCELATESIRKQRQSLERATRSTIPATASTTEPPPPARKRRSAAIVLAALVLAGGAAMPLAHSARSRVQALELQAPQPSPPSAPAAPQVPAASSAALAVAPQVDSAAQPASAAAPPRASDAAQGRERAAAPHGAASRAAPPRRGSKPAKLYMPDDL
jgi:serine/threonine-protein kinase